MLPCYSLHSVSYFLLILKGLVGVHRTIQLQLLQCYWLGHRLGLLWYWMVYLGNEQWSFCCTAFQYCISDSFVDHDGHSISSEGFLPAVVDIMVIWVKFTLQIRSDQSLSHVRLFVTPWIPARQKPLSITNSQSSLRLTSIESVMPSSHLILCRPPSPPAPKPSQHQGLFQWVNSSHEVAKVLQLQHQSFQWTPRTDLL